MCLIVIFSLFPHHLTLFFCAFEGIISTFAAKNTIFTRQQITSSIVIGCSTNGTRQKSMVFSAEDHALLDS